MRTLLWVGGVLAVVAVAGLLLGRQPLKAVSYFANDPQACTTCHIMEPYYDTWERSAHRPAATCNDCHVPKHPVAGPAVKLRSAVRHAYVFFLGEIPAVIHIQADSMAVAQGNCLRCHGDLMGHYAGDTRRAGGKYCFECHVTTPHGK